MNIDKLVLTQEEIAVAIAEIPYDHDIEFIRRLQACNLSSLATVKKVKAYGDEPCPHCLGTNMSQARRECYICWQEITKALEEG